MHRGRIRKLTIISIVMTVLFCLLYPGNRLMAEEAVRYDEGRIKAMVEQYIKARMPWPQGVVRVVFPVKIKDVVLHGERITHQVQPKRNDGFVGDGLFSVRFYDNGYFLGEENVRVIMEVSMDMVVSNKVLNINSEIKPDDVQVVRKWVSRIPVNVMSEAEEVVGKKITVTIRPNTEITRNMLKEPVMIKRGKMVRIVLDNGSMQIATVGLSEEDGVHGSIIRVRNMSSKKTVFARVLGDSLVGIEF